MDPIKEAFIRVKEEISYLKEEIKKLNLKISFLEENFIKTQLQQNSISKTAHTSIPADNPTHSPTVPQEIRGLKIQNFDISTGNRGVPTDKPTDKQTNQQTDKESSFVPPLILLNRKSLLSSPIEDLKRAQDLLDSLDNIKKEIRLKFKALTNREMLLFSTIYSLEDQGVEEISYRLLAQHLNLTESSIRDYTNKLISKNIPLLKIKQKNKQVLLKIPGDFKKLISLSTLLKLREL